MPAPATATVHPMLITAHPRAPGAPLPVPRTQARRDLDRAIVTLAGAIAALERARAPLLRLASVDAEAQKAEVEWARLRSEHDTAIGKWIADGANGHRPPMSPEQVEIEIKIATLSADAVAARKAIPEHQAVVDRAAAAVSAASADRESALLLVAVETASNFAADKYAAALAEVLATEAILVGLVAELTARGNARGGSEGAIGAAGMVREAIAEARKAAVVEISAEAARRLLDALPVNPDAKLER